MAKLDFFDYLSDSIEKGLDDESFEFADGHDVHHFLEIVKRLAWDLPSAAGSLCSHIDLDDWSMYGITPDQVKHFEEEHGWQVDPSWFEHFDT